VNTRCIVTVLESVNKVNVAMPTGYRDTLLTAAWIWFYINMMAGV
jgi:hypothetical protein